MNMDHKITLYYAPKSRSSATLLLLEELGTPYELKVLNLEAGEQRRPDYLAVNPMGKVPAIKHGDAVITEQVAIYIYLADLFPEAKLAPPLGDPLRAQTRPGTRRTGALWRLRYDAEHARGPARQRTISAR
jgi:glutathione S-transferase